MIKSSETTDPSKKSIGRQEQNIEREFKREIKRPTRKPIKEQIKREFVEHAKKIKRKQARHHNGKCMFSTTIDCQVCICLQKRVITLGRNPSWRTQPSVTIAKVDIASRIKYIVAWKCFPASQTNPRRRKTNKTVHLQEKGTRAVASWQGAKHTNEWTKQTSHRGYEMSETDHSA